MRPHFPFRPAVARVLLRAGVSLLAGAGCLGLASPRPAAAATKLEGEYNIQLDIRKQDRFFQWDFESNNSDTYSNAQFRLFTQPRPNVEGFLKYEARWHPSDNNSERPVFQYREAHARYKWDLKGNRGFDTYLFSRQDRFWVDNYLIRVVDGGTANDGGNAQGIRVNNWGYLGGVNASLIISDFSGQFDPTNSNAGNKDITKTDDGLIFRARREFFDKKLRTGITYNRRNENQTGDEQNVRGFASVTAGDVRYTFRNIDFSLEYAQSATRGPGPTVRNQDALGQKFLGLPLSDRGTWVGEIRSIHVGNAKFGTINVAPFGFIRGPLYDNRLGDSDRDVRGFTLNSWYLVPARAITLSNSYTHWKKKASIRRDYTELYSEAYIEFVNGFTGKVFYRRKRTTDDIGNGLSRVDKNDDIFVEAQVESRLAWFRVEGKVKNLDTPFSKQLAAIELSVNLSSHTKLYNRLVFGNDPTGLRRVYFTQLQYKPAGNMELYVEYGPGWIGDGNRPVDDGDLEGSGVQKDLVKFWLKGTF